MKGLIGGVLGGALGAGLAWLLPYAPLWYAVFGATLLVLMVGSSSQSSDTAGARLFTVCCVGVAWYAAYGGEHRLQVVMGWVALLGGTLGTVTGIAVGEGPSGARVDPSEKDVERCRAEAVAALEHDFEGQTAVHSPYPRFSGGLVVFRFRVGGRPIEYGVNPESFAVQRLEVSV